MPLPGPVRVVSAVYLSAVRVDDGGVPDPLSVGDVTYLSASRANLSHLTEESVRSGAACPSELPLRVLTEFLLAWGPEAQDAVFQCIREDRMMSFIARGLSGRYYHVTESGNGFYGASVEAVVENLMTSTKYHGKIQLDDQEGVVRSLGRKYLEEIRLGLAQETGGRVMTGVAAEDLTGWAPHPPGLFSVDGSAALLYAARGYDLEVIGKLIGSGHTVVQKTDRKLMWPVNKLRGILGLFPQAKSPIRRISSPQGDGVYLVLLDWDQVPGHLR